MASLLMMGSSSEVVLLLLLLVLLSSPYYFLTVMSAEFEVGGDNGWVVPPSKNDQLYNQWASNNRFKVDDSLQFEYKKDSVLVVTEEEYEKCRSSHPIFFSNNGDTTFKLDRPGLFYFISGVAGHCQRGLKMVVKVLEPETPPPPPPNGTSDPSQKSCAAAMAEPASLSSPPTFAMVTIIAFFGARFL